MMKGLANTTGVIVLQYINVSNQNATYQITQWYMLIISQFLNDKKQNLCEKSKCQLYLTYRLYYVYPYTIPIQFTQRGNKPRKKKFHSVSLN